MKTIGIKASDKQLSKLRNGHAVRLLPGVTRQLVVDDKLHAKMLDADGDLTRWERHELKKQRYYERKRLQQLEDEAGGGTRWNKVRGLGP